MEIVSKNSEITSWELTECEYSPPTKYGEKPGFLLSRELSGIYRCVISADAQIDCPDTAFYLDLKFLSTAEFSPSSDKPLERDLYEVYKKVWLDWRMKVLHRSKKEIGFMIVTTTNPLPFEEVSQSIRLAIQQSRRESN